MFGQKYQTHIVVHGGLQCLSYHTDRNGWWYNIVYLSDRPTGAGFAECDMPVLLKENSIPINMAKTLFKGLRGQYV